MAITDIDGDPRPSGRLEKDRRDKVSKKGEVCCLVFKGNPNAKGQAIGKHKVATSQPKVCAEQLWWDANFGKLAEAIKDSNYGRIEFEISSEPCATLGKRTGKECKQLIFEELHKLVKNSAGEKELVVFITRLKIYYKACGNGGWIRGAYGK